LFLGITYTGHAAVSLRGEGANGEKKVKSHVERRKLGMKGNGNRNNPNGETE